MTGGDRQVGRYMGRDFFEFDPQYKLWVVGNDKPGIKTGGEAMRRRLRLLPFETIIPEHERDPDLLERLKAEAGKILRWCIEGCLAWQRHGLAAPATVTASSEEYLEEEDKIALWLNERCEASMGEMPRTKDFYADWVSWSKARGEWAGSHTAFTRSVIKHGVKSAHSEAGECFHHVRLRPDTDHP